MSVKNFVTVTAITNIYYIFTFFFFFHSLTTKKYKLKQQATTTHIFLNIFFLKEM